MKIAVTAQGPGMDSPVDQRFGRAACFVLVDTDSGEHTVLDNATNLQAAQGAGVQAAQAVLDAGVEVVLTGHAGPKAFAALSAAGVAVCTGATGTVAEAVAKHQAGELTPADSADVGGHW